MSSFILEIGCNNGFNEESWSKDQHYSLRLHDGIAIQCVVSVNMYSINMTANLNNSQCKHRLWSTKLFI
jgi:hypothetical protein